MSSGEQDPFVGRLVLGRFRIVQLLATGGMGKIYLARSEGAEGFVKPVVIKRVIPDLMGDDSMTKMFVREARIMASLQHPGIVAVTDFAREGDDYVMAMEYVHGYNLSRWLRYVREKKQAFPVLSAVQIAIDVLEALHYAHTAMDADGKPMVVIHRDVTPSNVLIDIDGRVKLLDFGIARSNTELTMPNGEGPTLKGKFPYMSPEVLSGDEPSPCSDLYSVAVMLHEVLLGRNEFVGTDMKRTLVNVLRLAPTQLDSVRPDVSPDLAAVIARGLAKNPEARFATALEFAAALRDVRQMESDAAHAELRMHATCDFHDGALAAGQGVDSLTTLDRAWRHATGRYPSVRIERDPTPPTVADHRREAAMTVRPPVLRSVPPDRRRAPWVWIALTALVAALAGGAALGVSLARERAVPRNGAQFVYVQGNVTTGDPPTPTPAPPRPALPTSEPPTVAAVPDPTGSADAGPPLAHHGVVPTVTAPHPVDPTVALTRTFVRQQSRITHCFDAADPGVSNNPDLAVRFQIDRAGNVLNAEFLPSSLESSPFATCVLRVAQGVHFGEQPNAVAFRIPLTVHRVGGVGER